MVQVVLVAARRLAIRCLGLRERRSAVRAALVVGLPAPAMVVQVVRVDTRSLVDQAVRSAAPALAAAPLVVPAQVVPVVPAGRL